MQTTHLDVKYAYRTNISFTINLTLLLYHLLIFDHLLSCCSSFNLFFFLVVNNPGTSDSTGPPGGDETDLFTWRGVSSDGGRFTDMLMVSSSVGMLDWILGDTSDFWPAVSLHSELVVGSAGFEHWLVDSSTASDEAEHRSVSAGVQLFDAGRQLHSGFAGVGVVRDDGAVPAGSLGDLAPVSGFLLQLANDGTFWHLSDWHNVTNREGGFLTGVDELSGADAFRADHGLGDLSVFIWIFELDFAEWGAPAWVVHDVFDEALYEALSLGIVERSELGGAFSAFGSAGEDGPSTFSLALNHSSHTNVSVSST